jgi:diguanylate cyclase (GGDEF)-like protein
MDPTDAITGLPGHLAFRAGLERLVQLREPFSLLSIDLDGLKAVNGFAQYERGDEMLRRTGQAIVAVSPEGALVFRSGGDEFAVLVATAVAREAAQLGERICAAVAAIEVPESDEPDPVPSRLACSIGVALYPADGQTAFDLIQAAAQWMFIAKHMGGGRVALADTASMTWLTDQREGLTNRP